MFIFDWIHLNYLRVKIECLNLFIDSPAKLQEKSKKNIYMKNSPFVINKINIRTNRKKLNNILFILYIKPIINIAMIYLLKSDLSFMVRTAPSGIPNCFADFFVFTGS